MKKVYILPMTDVTSMDAELMAVASVLDSNPGDTVSVGFTEEENGYNGEAASRRTIWDDETVDEEF